MADEFHHLYVFNLRGNQRTAGEVSRREGGKIFDAGSRATVAVMLLVKQAGEVPEQGGTLHYRDIGDYLTRREKLAIVAEALPVADDGTLSLASVEWTTIQPNAHGDWINPRSKSFAGHLQMTATTDAPGVFELRTLGLATGRDAWNYNSSRSALDANVMRMISSFNGAADAYDATAPSGAGTLAERARRVEQRVGRDPAHFSWNRNAFTDVARGTRYSADDRLVMRALYRPFHHRWVEAGRQLNAMVYQLPRVFPHGQAENLTIAVSNQGARTAFSALMVRDLPDLNIWIDPTPCFPLFVFDASKGNEGPPRLFDDPPPESPSGRRHNITDHALAAYRSLDSAVERDDIFFYVYGILHSPDYRTAFAADLKKSLPRIPQVATPADFWAYSKAGRDLASLHTDYESIEPWTGLTHTYAAGFDPQHLDAYRVLKMKHPKVADPLDPKGVKVEDRSRIIYNDWITIGAIPERAYGYELGSRSALAWVMESNRVRTDKASGIRNDPNDWATEHDDPSYVLNLVGRIVTVSMRTIDIVDSLPNLAL